MEIIKWPPISKVLRLKYFTIYGERIEAEAAKTPNNCVPIFASTLLFSGSPSLICTIIRLENIQKTFAADY